MFCSPDEAAEVVSYKNNITQWEILSREVIITF